MSILDHISKTDQRKILTFGSIIIAIASLVLIFTVELPDNNKEVAGTILGTILGASVTQAYNFHFGSSQGSVDKNEMINGKGR